VRERLVAKREEHREWVRRTGEDLPEVRQWRWEA
jgi:xylulose-5-phosphate/fructose-6-phosphate phosphoketolase